ncbi:MAG TPA: hypothetical protein VF691_03280 [Cytophagaceae bacterium]|jgi:hypothetical protein
MKFVVCLKLCFLLSFVCDAQTFESSAQLRPVPKDGYYQLLLGPSIAAHLQESFQDIRIYDSKGKEVPYLLMSEAAVATGESFREYPIKEQTIIDKCCTRLIFSTPQRPKINNLALVIKNAEVRKKAKLSGSDDAVSWYIIKDNFDLESIYHSANTSEIKMLDFPMSDYAFYKLDIDDSLNPPLNIKKIGFYDNWQEQGKYLTLPMPKITQRDSSDKRSYVYINFPSFAVIDQLKFKIRGPHIYRREASFYSVSQMKGKEILTPIDNITLRSNQHNEIKVPGLYMKAFCLVIENLDNSPVMVNEVKALQLSHKLLVYLDSQEKFTLKFGSKDVGIPQYDLEYFRDSIPTNLPDVSLGPIEEASMIKNPAQAPDFFRSTTWIWLAIAAIILLLGFMSYKMISEMKEKETKL